MCWHVLVGSCQALFMYTVGSECVILPSHPISSLHLLPTVPFRLHLRQNLLLQQFKGPSVVVDVVLAGRDQRKSSLGGDKSSGKGRGNSMSRSADKRAGPALRSVRAMDVRRRQRKSGRSSMALRATTAAALMVRSIAAFPLRFSSSLSLADARDSLVIFRLILPVLVSQSICRGRSYLSWASGLFDRRRYAAAVVATAAAAPARTRKSGG